MGPLGNHGEQFGEFWLGGAATRDNMSTHPVQYPEPKLVYGIDPLQLAQASYPKVGHTPAQRAQKYTVGQDNICQQGRLKQQGVPNGKRQNSRTRIKGHTRVQEENRQTQPVLRDDKMQTVRKDAPDATGRREGSLALCHQS